MKPTIVLENEVWRKVMHWVNKSNLEVSGLGTIRVEENGVIRVLDAMLLPQKNGSTHTDIEAEEVNKALFALRNSPGDLRWWWHSHVNMNVFWSGTDMDTIKKIGGGGWFACSVFNKKREVRSAAYLQQGQVTPWGTLPLFLDELDTKVVEYVDPQTSAWDAEYDKNVTEFRAPALAYTGGHTYGNVHHGWEKNEHGVWVKKGEHSTQTSGGSATTAGQVTTYDEKETPPEKRPANMSKRTYKRWKRAHTEYLLSTHKEGHRIAALNEDLKREGLPADPDDDYDDYGFSQEERLMLAREGWDESDLDELFTEHDFSGLEILELARLGVVPQEIYYMLSAGYAVGDIIALARQSDDTPVADRGQAGGMVQ